MEYIPIRVSDIIRRINDDLYLPAIQRELVWLPEQIELLFDSIMRDFPIGSFLFWKLEPGSIGTWPVYEFIRDFDDESPHNPVANLNGTGRDIDLVLDGQQRIGSLYVGLCGTYRSFYYRWRKQRLHLNLFKIPEEDEDNPEELVYDFMFREKQEPPEDGEFWYSVGEILNYEDAEDAKSDLVKQLERFSPAEQENANKLIGRLHSRVHTTLVGNYYEERSQDHEKVLQIFVRANSGGQRLEYSDILLATATAQWETLNAREEIGDFTDTINDIGAGFNFDKDFVLKACLYLCENLDIKYKVKNFTRANLHTIEQNWENIKDFLLVTVRLMARFGFHGKSVVAPNALLPIAFYLQKLGNRHFDSSSEEGDAGMQREILKWFVVATLKRALGGSSDTTLSRLRDVIKSSNVSDGFPSEKMYKSLELTPSFNDDEIDRILAYKYGNRYAYAVLTLLYGDRSWKDTRVHQDHIFPKSRFTKPRLIKTGINEQRIGDYLDRYNLLTNLQLLTESENLAKGKVAFSEWLASRDDDFKRRHVIPDIDSYNLEDFLRFTDKRAEMMRQILKNLT